MKMQDKTILFTCAGFGGGVGKMMRFVSKLCVERFRKVYLLHRGRGSSHDIPPEGVNEIILPAETSVNPLLWRFSQIKELRKEINKIKPDIICCFGTEQAVMIAIAVVGLKNIKLVQCDRTDPYTRTALWNVLSKWAFSRADACVFQLEKQGAWYGEKIMQKSVVIPNAFIPTGEVEPHDGERKKTIVSVGRFVYEKNYEILIRAFKLVHDRFPDYRLILYGDGPYRAKYEQLITDFSIQDVVEMPGFIDNAMNEIKDASVFVLSSIYEGIPNTLIEALAVGVPTVSTDCTPGGPDFLTNHGERGLLVPINDVEAMANSIIKIIGSPQLANELSNKGTKIISMLNVSVIASKWIEFFQGMLLKSKQ